MAETWQLAAEAIMPMNREAGRGAGARISGADTVRKAVVETMGLRSNQAHVPEALRLHQFLPGKRCRGGC